MPQKKQVAPRGEAGYCYLIMNSSVNAGDRQSHAVNIILTGFMGTGKSTVGRLLAQRLQRPFLDMDKLIEERAGRPISAIFADEGENGFRDLERRLVEELSGRSGLVIATGGGVVLNPDNVRDFARTGLLVCLDASPQRILERVAHETHRPLLAGPCREKRVKELLQARRKAYESVAFHVDTNELTPVEVSERILARLSRRNTV